MNLKTYLEKNDITRKEFAGRINISDQVIIMLCTGRRKTCSKRTAAAIEKATYGQVTGPEVIFGDDYMAEWWRRVRRGEIKLSNQGNPDE